LTIGAGTGRKKRIELGNRTKWPWRELAPKQGCITPNFTLGYPLLEFAKCFEDNRSARLSYDAPFVRLGRNDVAGVYPKLVAAFRAAHHGAALGNERIVKLVFNATARAANVHEISGDPAAGVQSSILRC
jgi:hypothetical protein